MKDDQTLDDTIDNNILFCPKKGCIGIPEMSYNFEPLKSTVKYKCNLHDDENESEIELSKFLKESSINPRCPFCQMEIKDNSEIFYCKQCKIIFNKDCYNFHNTFYKAHEVIKINQNILYNYCLNHNNPFIFRCVNCNESLCGLCDLNFHNSFGHELKQIINIINNKNEKEKINSNLKKQKDYLKKIKEINNKIFESLENDIIIKERIIQNSESNKFNYQTIINYNNLKVQNNDKYENILTKIIDDYEKNKNNNNNDPNILINQFLSPLYYCMMINPNQDFNNNLNKAIDKQFNNNKEKSENKENINNKDNNSTGKKTKKDSQVKTNVKKKYVNKDKEDKKEEGNTNELNIIIEKDSPYKEINTIKVNKPINNMIVLHTNNIALSSTGFIYIYDSNLKNLIQEISINKRNVIKYIYEFPDETLLCAISSKIYRIKLIDNDTNFNLLGYIKMGKSELATKLISLGNNFLVALTEQRQLCNLKVFMKNNTIINDDNNNDNEIYSISNNDNDYCSSYNSSEIKQNNRFNKDMIKIDKEFKLCGGGNVNVDKKLLCSIFGISKNNQNEYSYEFIATSNFVYDLGGNRLEFFEIKQLENNILSISRTKLIENISCSTEADSICQLNDDFLCVGLQNHDLKGQISGYAIIDINKKEIHQIIRDNEIYCLNFIKEKNLLMAAMEVRNEKGNYNMIKMYNFRINKENNVELEKICQFKAKHENIIVSLLELKKIDCVPTPWNSYNFEKTYEKSNIICASASLDSTVKIIEANI